MKKNYQIILKVDDREIEAGIVKGTRLEVKQDNTYNNFKYVYIYNDDVMVYSKLTIRGLEVVENRKLDVIEVYINR